MTILIKNKQQSASSSRLFECALNTTAEAENIPTNSDYF